MAEKNFRYGAAERLRTKLNDSITLAKNPFDIILEMAEILGEISGEKNYYRNVREQIAAAYGLALNDKFVLEKEIEAVSARLKKIEAAYQNPDFDDEEHKRIGFALERHKREIERLKEMKNG